MSFRIKLSALARALAVPACLVVMAWASLLAQDLVSRHQVVLNDLRAAYDAAVLAGESSIADRLSNAAERTLAASSAAGHVARVLAGIAALGAIAFLIFGAASRSIRTGSLIGVLLVLLSTGFRDVY